MANPGLHSTPMNSAAKYLNLHASKWRLLFLAALLTITGCGAMQPPETDGPRVNQQVYPLLLREDPQRRDAASNAVYQLLAAQASTSQVALQPVTATIQSLPAAEVLLYLPRIGSNPTMSEEETRESLRRFIDEWSLILGANPNQLSLVQRIDQTDGKKLASYEQRPFRYPLRGDYGKLQILFTSDRRVLSLVSTCIPDAERLQSSLYALTPVVKPEDAIKYVRENALNYLDNTGGRQVVTLSAASAVDAKDLVFYARMGQAEAIELHLAWAVTVTNAPFKTLYLDAIKAEVLGTE